MGDSVDGRNPAPVDSDSWFIHVYPDYLQGFIHPQVVQDFFHQQFHPCSYKIYKCITVYCTNVRRTCETGVGLFFFGRGGGGEGRNSCPPKR